MRIPRTFAAALVLAFASASARADVLIFGQPGSYPTLQGAVDAAVDGDVLLIEPKPLGAQPYAAAVIDGKGLHLHGLSTGPYSSVSIRGTLEVRNLPAASAFTLTDVQVGWGYQGTATFGKADALWVRDCAGHVRVQRCALRAGIYASWPSTVQVGVGLRVESSPNVVVAASDVIGGDWKFWSGLPAVAGGDGLVAVQSGVALYDSLIQGGGGSNETYPTGGNGGAGLRLSDYGVYASGCTIRGGQGGGGDYIGGCTYGGDGGTGLIGTDAQVQLLETTVQGGPAGTFGLCGPGSEGATYQLVNTILIQHPGSARSLDGPRWTDDKQPLTFTVEGEPGDQVWILRGRAPAFQPTASPLGPILVPKPWKLPLAPMGVVPASGVLDVTVWLADLPGPQPGALLYAQALIFGAGGEVRLSGPLHVLVRNT